MTDGGSARREPVARAPIDAGELGDYRLLAKLGSGGQADVYLALSQGPVGVKRLAVVKRLRSGHELDEEHVTMFLDEARLAARLSHPNVVTTYEVGQTARGYFIAMEYLDGQSLERVMRAPGVETWFSPRMWAAVAADVLAGLHYAHELCDYDGSPLGIVHRDVSPHNIFLTYSGETKLVDFGVAKASLNTFKTESGVLKGKVTYMSPEQARGVHTDRRSDVFAMGIVLWEAVTGKRLFIGDALQILNKLLNAEIPPPSQKEPAVHPALDAIVVRALAAKPEDRFQTADEMRKALLAYLKETGEPIPGAVLGQALTSMFGDAHAHAREKIAAYVATVESGGRHRVTSLAESDPEVPELSEIIQRSAPPATILKGDEGEGAKPRRRSFVLPVAALAALGVAGAAALAIRDRAKPAPALPPAIVAPAPRETAMILLESEPPGAMVSWNGRPMGRTPLRAELPVGAQTVVLSKDGYDDEPIVVELKAGQDTLRAPLVTLNGKPGLHEAPPAPPSAVSPGSRAASPKPPRHVSGPPGAEGSTTPSPPSSASTPAANATASAPRRVAPKENW